ncbi:MAG: hypothetical protein V2B18_23045 [Pseudomonadota bacterium]
MKYYQQGDILIKPVKAIPKNAGKLSDNVLARGEATGHAHVAWGVDALLYRSGERLYLNAPNGAEIKHEEHGPITVPRGTYLIEKVREYDHFVERPRTVVD